MCVLKQKQLFWMGIIADIKPWASLCDCAGLLHPPPALLMMVRSTAAGLVRAATSLSTRRISDRTENRARWDRVCLRVCLWRLWHEWRVPPSDADTGERLSGCPRTRVTARWSPDLLAYLSAMNLSARGAARVSVTARWWWWCRGACGAVGQCETARGRQTAK